MYLHADAMWNFSNAVSGYKESRTWNFVPFVGVGWARSYGNDAHDNEIGFILLDEDGNEQEYYYVDEDNDGDGVRVERTSDGDEFDLGISREGVAAATRDVNAIYKDGVQVAAELKSTFDEISDSLSFLKKKK
mgnify:FL=1